MAQKNTKQPVQTKVVLTTDEEKKKALAQKNKKRLLSRIKRKAKSVIRPLYYRIKPGKNA